MFEVWGPLHQNFHRRQIQEIRPGNRLDHAGYTCCNGSDVPHSSGRSLCCQNLVKPDGAVMPSKLPTAAVLTTPAWLPGLLHQVCSLRSQAPVNFAIWSSRLHVFKRNLVDLSKVQLMELKTFETHWTNHWTLAPCQGAVLHEALGHLAAIPVARLLALLRLRSFGLKPFTWPVTKSTKSQRKVDHCYFVRDPLPRNPRPFPSSCHPSFLWPSPAWPEPSKFKHLVVFLFELGSATFDIASATLAASSSCDANQLLSRCRFIPSEICKQDCVLMIIAASST